MRHVSTAPFGRTQSLARLTRSRELATAPVSGAATDKWALLKDITVARQHFAISDRDLAVLSALLSFHPHVDLTEGMGTIVFPSNATLSNRLHGMAESTLRRHLAALVQAGLILRHNSPNGKRYAARDGTGSLAAVFGFDLRPLLVRADEIAGAARMARDAAFALTRLREAVILCLREAAGLVAAAQQAAPGRWDAYEDQTRLLQRCLRRKLNPAQLQQVQAEALTLLSAIEAALGLSSTAESSADAAQNERHIQDSDRVYIESEPEPEMQQKEQTPQNLPLEVVMQACPDLQDYVPHRMRHWHELVAASDFVRPMLGITRDVWRAARVALGETGAAVVLACILQSATRIKNPGGYLRSLTTRALKGAFSPEPMVLALLRAQERC